jgi:hypothetical protein
MTGLTKSSTRKDPQGNSILSVGFWGFTPKVVVQIRVNMKKKKISARTDGEKSHKSISFAEHSRPMIALAALLGHGCQVTIQSYTHQL